MKLLHKFRWAITAGVALFLTFGFVDQAMAIKYMSLKEAIKYFMPEGSKPSQVKKTIPDDTFEQIKKAFNLKETTDFKERISKGPYTFYISRDASDNPDMYILILDQYWRTCYHKYAVGIEPSGKIKEIVVVELNCPYAYPINKKSFLKQFKDKNAADGRKGAIEVGHGVDAISGATGSADATAVVARRALALFELFFSK